MWVRSVLAQTSGPDRVETKRCGKDSARLPRSLSASDLCCICGVYSAGLPGISGLLRAAPTSHPPHRHGRTNTLSAKLCDYADGAWPARQPSMPNPSESLAGANRREGTTRTRVDAYRGHVPRHPRRAVRFLGIGLSGTRVQRREEQTREPHKRAENTKRGRTTTSERNGTEPQGAAGDGGKRESGECRGGATGKTATQKHKHPRTSALTPHWAGAGGATRDHPTMRTRSSSPLAGQAGPRRRQLAKELDLKRQPPDHTRFALVAGNGYSLRESQAGRLGVAPAHGKISEERCDRSYAGRSG